MSFWIYRKNKDGKVNIFAAEVPIMLVVMVLGLLASFLGPAAYETSHNPSRLLIYCISFIGIGFSCILVAKVSLFRKGIWCSWGGSLMSKPFRIVYKCGYTFLVLGILLSLPLAN